MVGAVAGSSFDSQFWRVVTGAWSVALRVTPPSTTDAVEVFTPSV